MSELPLSAIDMIQHSHTLTGRYPRLVVTDLGTEFENKTLKEFARKNGIQFQPSPARAKELNGLSEKTVDTTKNHVRAMLLGAGLPAELGWKYAIQHFVYVWNRTHIGQRTGVSPYQSMTGREASVLNTGEFGCDVYVHQHRSTRDTTFGPKAEPAIYLGHSGRLNCPIVRMVGSGKVIMSKDVHFREGHFSHLRAVLNGTPEDIRQIDLNADAELDTESAHTERISEQYVESDEDDRRRETVRSASPEPRWELDGITDTRTERGVKQYLCKWTGHLTPTWEPASRIRTDAPEAVKEYETFLNRRIQEQEHPIAARTRSARKSAVSSEAPNSDVDDEEDFSSPMGTAAAHAARRL